MRRSLVGICFIGLTVFCLVSIGFDACAAEKGVKLRFAHFMATTTIRFQLAQEWCNEVEKQTEGRVKITLYPSGTLTQVTQTYDAVIQGSVDIGYGIFSYHRGRFPLTEVIDLPLGYRTGRMATRLINEYYKKFKPKELDDVKVLYLAAHGPGIFHAKKPINKLEDLRGMKIRASGLSAKIVSALGAVPVGLPITEAYDALSRGVADGITNDLGGVKNYNLGEVVKYHTENFGSAYTTGFYTIMNKQRWESLARDVQQIIERISEEWIEKAASQWDEEAAEVKNALIKKGNKFITLSKEEDARWAEKMKPIFADYVKTTKQKGLPGEEALRFCTDYLNKYDR